MSDREITADIIESCRKGDREAFHALFLAYKDKVYSIALYFFHGDEAAAGDITQQVFLKLLLGIGQFRNEADFSTWLYRLVVNACMDGARRAKPQKLVSREIDIDTLPGTESLERDFARAQTARSVRAALAALPVKFRLPVLLRYFEDLSYSEMASAMKCSMGTVASRLNRAHKMLAEKLEFLR
ncbi:MAG: sigma-70 family RNA polymerase sigma factor [Bryobacterales bacterium]|nr:sigma-70 family RNA polymerase sigma factor [Bryobacterales bacterium]